MQFVVSSFSKFIVNITLQSTHSEVQQARVDLASSQSKLDQTQQELQKVREQADSASAGAAKEAEAARHQVCTFAHLWHRTCLAVFAKYTLPVLKALKSCLTAPRALVAHVMCC